MYESPIGIIYGEMKTQIENDVLKAVQRVGVNVNKEELQKALQYDREQYSKGYNDGLNANKWIPCSERLPEKTAYFLVTIKGFSRPMYAWFMETEKVWQYLNSQVLIDNVVAWMPLPEPYKGE